jgi:hypothetical protein
MTLWGFKRSTLYHSSKYLTPIVFWLRYHTAIAVSRKDSCNYKIYQDAHHILWLSRADTSAQLMIFFADSISLEPMGWLQLVSWRSSPKSFGEALCWEAPVTSGLNYIRVWRALYRGVHNSSHMMLVLTFTGMTICCIKLDWERSRRFCLARSRSYSN